MRIKANEISDIYPSNRMQNEFILRLGNEVLQKIVKTVRESKYYSVILDCMPDASHQEKTTVILRCVNILGKSVDVVEHFVVFLAVDDSSESGLTDAFLHRLEELGLSIANCRGQGYDNGTNMRVSNKDVQARILQLESRVLFMPRGCHSLNLVLCGMATSSAAAMTLFGIIQQIHVLLSASIQRWSIF